MLWNEGVNQNINVFLCSCKICLEEELAHLYPLSETYLDLCLPGAQETIAIIQLV